MGQSRYRAFIIDGCKGKMFFVSCKILGENFAFLILGRQDVGYVAQIVYLRRAIRCMFPGMEMTAKAFLISNLCHSF